MPDQPRYCALQIEKWPLTSRNEELQLRTEELQRELKQERKHLDRTSKNLHAQLKLTKAQLRQAQEALNDEQDKLLVAERREERLEIDNEDLHRANAALRTELVQGGISDTRNYFEVLPRCGTFTLLCSSFFFRVLIVFCVSFVASVARQGKIRKQALNAERHDGA